MMNFNGMSFDLRFNRALNGEEIISPGGYAVDHKTFDFCMFEGTIDVEDRTVLHCNFRDFDFDCSDGLTQEDLQKNFTEFNVYLEDEDLYVVGVENIAFTVDGEKINVSEEQAESAMLVLLNTGSYQAELVRMGFTLHFNKAVEDANIICPGSYELEGGKLFDFSNVECSIDPDDPTQVRCIAKDPDKDYSCGCILEEDLHGCFNMFYVDVDYEKASGLCVTGVSDLFFEVYDSKEDVFKTIVASEKQIKSASDCAVEG